MLTLYLAGILASSISSSMGQATKTEINANYGKWIKSCTIKAWFWHGPLQGNKLDYEQIEVEWDFLPHVTSIYTFLYLKWFNKS